MSTNDEWLIERAQQKKQAAEDESQRAERERAAAVRRTRIFAEQVSDLWSEFEQELRRQAKVYSDALGDPKAVVVAHLPNAIDIQTSEGDQLTLTLGRDTQTITQVQHLNSGRIGGTPSAGDFTIKDDRLVFARGTPAEVAGGILRDLL